MAGLYYFHTGCRLLSAGFNRFEFMAEALLNFAKCLQSLFGDSLDKIRTELARLGSFDPQEIEGKIVPALVLRNEFDVAHVSLALLTRKQLKLLHGYTQLAEAAFRDLLRAVLEKIAQGEYALPPDSPPMLSSKKESVLRRLEKSIGPYV
jgi:hypothetical protein